jgi:hypothetical protein
MRLSKRKNTEQQSALHQARALPIFPPTFERRIANVTILVYSSTLSIRVAFIYAIEGLGAKDIEARIGARKN